MIGQLKKFIAVCLLLATAFSARALQTISLAWDPTPGTNVAGYYLYYGNLSGVYTSKIDVGTNTVCTLSDLVEGRTYYIVVKTYNQARIESLPSNEAGFTVPSGFPPQLNAINPGSAPAGSQVFIYGAHLSSATGVTFNGVAAAFNVSSDFLLVATVPAGAGNGQVSVATPYGSASTAFTVIPYATPANDNFANAQTLPAAAALVSVRTFGASKQAGEPNHAADTGGSSVWYRWTPLTSGTYTLDSSGGDFSMLLAVYTGSSVSNLSAVASNRNSGGYVNAFSFNATAGVTYRIAVDGIDGAAGNTLLRILPAPVLPIGTPPVILVGPPSQTVSPGDDIYLGVVATGTQPMSFQWYYNGTPIAGATKGLLALRNVTTGQGGNYYVVVSNGSGTATSTPALVTVLPNPFPNPMLATPAVAGTNGMQLNLSVAANVNYRLQASTNLISWTTIGTYYSYGTNITCFDPTATNYPRRFYRVVTP